MAGLERPLHQGADPIPAAKHGVDRKALREEISRRYENTLRRLGR